MSNWDNRFLLLAQHIAGWSKDPSTQVGAVVVDQDKRIVSTGYNGFARGVDDGRLSTTDREEKLRRTIHAEVNAILYARRDLTGCTIYVTHPPCARCAAVICQSGIKRVVAVKPEKGFEDRWGEDMHSAEMQFGEADIRFDLRTLG